MRNAQKIIKVFALFLAAAIIIGIITALMGVVSLIGLLVGADYDGLDSEISTVWQEESASYDDIKNLKVDTGASNVRIVQTSGNKASVETNNNRIESSLDGKTLRVKEKSGFVFSGFWRAGELVISLPEKLQLDKIDLDVGAGTLYIENLKAKDIDLELGAGKTSIKNLESTVSSKIDGGAGLIELDDSKLHNLKLELGAGKADITAYITGNSKIHSGVGKLELNLLGAADDYQFDIDKGIGSVQINGASQHDDSTYGNGSNRIQIDSGVGAVEITTATK